jgi:hypothetical protein
MRPLFGATFRHEDGNVTGVAETFFIVVFAAKTRVSNLGTRT